MSEIFGSRSKIIFLASSIVSFALWDIPLHSSLNESTLLLSTTRIAFSESINTSSCENTEKELLGNLVLSDEILNSLMTYTLQTGLEIISLKAADILKKQCLTNAFAKHAVRLTKELELIYTVFFKEPTPGHFLIEVYGPAFRKKHAQLKKHTDQMTPLWSELKELAELQKTEFDEFLSTVSFVGNDISDRCSELIKRNCALALFAQELIANDKAFLFKFNLSQLMKTDQSRSYSGDILFEIVP